MLQNKNKIKPNELKDKLVISKEYPIQKYF